MQIVPCYEASSYLHYSKLIFVTREMKTVQGHRFPIDQLSKEMESLSFVKTIKSWEKSHFLEV